MSKEKGSIDCTPLELGHSECFVYNVAERGNPVFVKTKSRGWIAWLSCIILVNCTS